MQKNENGHLSLTSFKMVERFKCIHDTMKFLDKNINKKFQDIGMIKQSYEEDAKAL